MKKIDFQGDGSADGVVGNEGLCSISSPFNQMCVIRLRHLIVCAFAQRKALIYGGTRAFDWPIDGRCIVLGLKF